MSRIQDETARGALWNILQRITVSPIQFLFGIILARLITPDEMGILGLTGIFFAFASQLQEGGFGAALIRKQNRTEKDINTVFWFNTGMSFILSSCLFAAAPWFAVFFNQPPLTNLTRVSAVLMFLQSTANVHWTLYRARRDFKTPAIVGTITTLVPMPFTIWAAYEGWSYWAPMLQGVMGSLLSLAIVWIISPWRPRFLFSSESFRQFFGFSFRLVLSGTVWTTYSNLRTFLIGKFYSPAQLALFSRGYATTDIFIRVVQGTVGDVTFPILSTIQHDTERLINVYRKYIRMTALVVSWGMITMAANSHALMMFLYGERWVGCAIYAQLLCLGIMFDPFSNINSNLYTVIGRTDMCLKKEVILRIFGISAMLVGARHSVIGVCIAAVLTGWMAFILSLFLTTRICSLRIRQQLADILPYLIMALLANIPSVLISQLGWASWCNLAAGGTASLLIYMLLLIWRRDSTGAQLYSYAREKMAQRFWKAEEP